MNAASFWQQLPCVAVDIGVGPEGGAWMCGAQSAIFQWTGAAWSRVEGEAQRVAVGAGDTPWIVGADHKVRRREGGAWIEVTAPAPAADIGVDPFGGAWMLGQDGSIYTLVSGSFVRFRDSARRIAAGPDRRPYIVAADGEVQRFDGQTWVPLAAQPVQATDVGVGADGTVWCVGADLVVRRLDAAAKSWVASDALALAVAVGPDGAAWAIRRDGSVARQAWVPAVYTDRDFVTEAYWQTLQVAASDVAVGPEGDPWLIATDNGIYQFTGVGWTRLDGLARRITVGPNNQAWVVGMEGKIWRRDGAAWTLVTEVPGGAEDLAVGPSGALWIVGVDQGVYRWSGSGQPVRLDGAAHRVAADREDRAWVVGLNRALFYRVSDAWLQVAPPPGGAADVAAGVDGSIWATGLDGRVYRLNADRSGWTACAVQASSIAVAPHGGAWAVQNDARIIRHTPSRLAGPARDFVISLWWRYVGRAPDSLGVEGNVTRLLNGALTRAALEDEFRGCVESTQRLAQPRRDLIPGLYWMYLGRHPTAADIDYHVAWLVTGKHTEATLEEYFRTCPEAQAHGLSTTQELVLGLWWRYLGHGPWAEELAATVALPLTREQMIARFRDAPEACARRRPFDRDFVIALYWRHLGRYPDDVGLEAHLGRLLSGSITREGLAAEFAACPEARDYQRTQAPLVILGAAYTGAPAGKEDVTSTVRSWVREDQILRGWTPAELGATGDGNGHVLVIVYRYGNGPARTKIVHTGWAIELWPRVDDRLQGSPCRMAPDPAQLTILGAAYGRNDVTLKARSRVAKDRLYVDVNDVTWDHAGSTTASARSLVVVYQVGDGPPIVHVTAFARRAYVNAPPLTILGATFGQVDVTAALAAQVRGGTLEVMADKRLVGHDPWPGVVKTAAVVYRHGGANVTASVLVVTEQQMLAITPETAQTLSPDAVHFTDLVEVNGEPRAPLGLRILGAAYGLTNVTGRAIEQVRDDLLAVRADNATWGGGALNTPKTLMIVYQIDGGRPMLRLATEGAQFTIAAPRILGASWGPLDVTDRIAAVVRGGVPGVVASNDTFGDSLPTRDKFLTVCFRHGEGPPQIRVFNEGEPFSLPTTAPRGALPPSLGLQILGASWGPRDVTSAARFCDRDFVNSLFWRHIGRAPQPAELDGHTQRLVADTITRGEMEAEFATCPEGRARATFSERDFVRSLGWRYLKRALIPVELEWHAGRLIRGETDRAAQEAEFCGCPEAQQAGPPTDERFAVSLFWRHDGRAPAPAELQAALGSGKTRDQLAAEIAGSPEAKDRARLLDHDFVVSLYWRYLGKAPDVWLANHFRRLVDGAITREALAEEFRTCPEALAYVKARVLRADNTSWGDSLPGKLKLLTVVYRVADGEPQTAVLTEGEALALPQVGLDSAAHLLTRVRTLRDLQAPPAQTIDVAAPGTKVPGEAPNGAAPANGTPSPRAVHQVVLVPRRRDGAALPPTAYVTIVCAEALEILTDQPGRSTLYRLAANVPLDLAVPASGQCRLALPLKDGQITAPLLRARWDEMPPGAWAVIATDQHLHATLADLRTADLIDPPAGATSPIAPAEAGRCHALKASLAPLMRACQDFELRMRLPDGQLRVPAALELGAVTLPEYTSLTVPPHVIVPAGAVLSRVLVTGATRYYRLRSKLRQRAVELVQAGLFDFIDDIGDAFEDAIDFLDDVGDQIASAFTTAINATIGGLEGAFRSTLEGFQALVTVAEQYAVTGFKLTTEALSAAQCVLVDATNGLVAFAVSVKDGVVSVVRTVIHTLEDVALLVADQVARVALKIKEIVEFIIMMLLWNWTDILETQRYLAEAINVELDAFPQFAQQLSGSTSGLCDAIVAAIDADRSAPSASLRRTALPDFGPLGDAFEFIFDRLMSGIAALTPSDSGDAQLEARLNDLMLSLHGIEPPALSSATLLAESDPHALFALLKGFARQVIEALRDGLALALAAGARASVLVKQALNVHLYIPVLTELIETFIFRGRSELTPLTLVTLLAGAGFNNMYKLITGSRRGPFHGASSPVSMLASPATQAALADAALVSFGPSDDPEPDMVLVTAMDVLGGVCSAISFAAGRGWKIDKAYANPMSFAASVCGMVSTCAQHRDFGRWFIPEMLVGVCNSAAVLASSRPDGAKAQTGLGVVQCVAATIAGIGSLVDERPHPEQISLRMSSEVLTGLADVFHEDKQVSLMCTGGAFAVTLTGMVTSLATD